MMISRMKRAPSVLRDFLRTEASGGLLLIAASVLALAIANSNLAYLYFDMLRLEVAGWDLVHFVNDGLMAIFFLLVGLEIKREFLDGHLQQPADRVLPLLAAAGGMAVPAVVFLAIAGRDPALARGWAIPAATDIAFAIGVLALLGNRVPGSLKIFLTTIAIADDLGAVIIIALAYTAALHFWALGTAVLIYCAMIALNLAGIGRLMPYMLLTAALWAVVHLSGVHATVAGVLAASAIPIVPSRGAPDAENSPLHRLEHALGPWVAYAILPLFAFVNAGVSFRDTGGHMFLDPLTLAIAAGLFLGKQIGIFSSVRIAVAIGFGAKPSGASWLQVYGLSLICGIGFTMSLFIGKLAFPDAAQAAEVKTGVLSGSLLSAIVGAGVLVFASRKRSGPQAQAGSRRE